MRKEAQVALDRWFDDFQHALEHPERRREGQAVIALPPRLIGRIFSEKRVGLMEVLYRRRLRSISELAELTGRKIDAVSRDLKILSNFGLVRYERHGKRKEPVAVARYALIELPGCLRPAKGRSALGDTTGSRTSTRDLSPMTFASRLKGKSR